MTLLPTSNAMKLSPHTYLRRKKENSPLATSVPPTIWGSNEPSPLRAVVVNKFWNELVISRKERRVGDTRSLIFMKWSRKSVKWKLRD
jgi:hypothetical protein